MKNLHILSSPLPSSHPCRLVSQHLKIIGVAPVRKDGPAAAEKVTDSSRYFVLRIENAQGMHNDEARTDIPRPSCCCLIISYPAHPHRGSSGILPILLKSPPTLHPCQRLSFLFLQEPMHSSESVSTIDRTPLILMLPFKMQPSESSTSTSSLNTSYSLLLSPQQQGSPALPLHGYPLSPPCCVSFSTFAEK